MADERKRRRWPWVVLALFVLLVLYPLSYAPFIKAYIYFGGPPGRWVDGTTLPFYRPVDWLIDNTPLQLPLQRWARLWGDEVEVNFVLGMKIREVQRLFDDMGN